MIYEVERRHPRLYDGFVWLWLIGCLLVGLYVGGGVKELFWASDDYYVFIGYGVVGFGVGVLSGIKGGKPGEESEDIPGPAE